MLVKWAKDTERYLRSSIVNKGLVDTGKLKNSVKMEMLGITTDVKTFVFRFQLKGMFVDMGVFGGKTLAESRDAATVRRILGKRLTRKTQNKNLSKRQYGWYSRTMYGGIAILGRQMMALYGNKASAAMKIPEVIEI